MVCVLLTDWLAKLNVNGYMMSDDDDAGRILTYQKRIDRRMKKHKKMTE